MSFSLILFLLGLFCCISGWLPYWETMGTQAWKSAFGEDGFNSYRRGCGMFVGGWFILISVLLTTGFISHDDARQVVEVLAN